MMTRHGGVERHSHEEDVQENRLHSIVSDKAAEALILDDARVDGKEDNQTAKGKRQQPHWAGRKYTQPTFTLK